MKKTISVTLGGRIFAVEEDGFSLLEEYLTNLKCHFAGDESADELITDIETSIGEKFSEKLGPHAQAITIDDVRETINIMGKPEEISESETGTTPSISNAEALRDERAHKHLYRDSDNQVIAGVCSGLAAYFGLSVTTIRILFLILAFFNGIGILIYLILWAAVPLAQTNAQKLEMRGKPMNVEEIKHLVQEKAHTMREEGKGAYQRISSEHRSTFQKILNVPVVVIGAIFRALRSFVTAIGPIVSVIVGIGILFGSVIGLTMATVFATIFLFPSRSTYVISGLPLTELANQPFYYVGVVAGYLLALVPMVFLFILAATLIRRKNSFRAIPAAVLIGTWILSASAFALSARDVGPWAYNRVQQIEKESTVTRTFPYHNFDAIASSGAVNVIATPGKTYTISVTGNVDDVDTLSVTKTSGTLNVVKKERQRSPCLFCVNRGIQMKVTLPELRSYTATNRSGVLIEGFRNDLTVDVGDGSYVDLALGSQHATATVRDLGRLVVNGIADQFTGIVTDAARLDIGHLEADIITLTQKDASRATLEGKTNVLTASLADASRLDARELDADRVTITTQDASYANVAPRTSIEATSKDMSRIIVESETASTTFMELDASKIRGPISQ